MKVTLTTKPVRKALISSRLYPLSLTRAGSRPNRTMNAATKTSGRVVIRTMGKRQRRNPADVDGWIGGSEGVRTDGGVAEFGAENGVSNALS